MIRALRKVKLVAVACVIAATVFVPEVWKAVRQ